MIRIKKVLVATDFSEPSAAALQSGREVARAFGATLEVLHVADNVYVTYEAEMYVPATPALQLKIEQVLQQQVADLLIEEDYTALHAKADIITAVVQAKAIVDYAQQHAIDVIVMGTHGRAGTHLFTGSVAERVVRTATCPVLTVHSPRQECLAPDILVPIALARA